MVVPAAGFAAGAAVVRCGVTAGTDGADKICPAGGTAEASAAVVVAAPAAATAAVGRAGGREAEEADAVRESDGEEAIARSGGEGAGGGKEAPEEEGRSSAAGGEAGGWEGGKRPVDAKHAGRMRRSRTRGSERGGAASKAVTRHARPVCLRECPAPCFAQDDATRYSSSAPDEA